MQHVPCGFGRRKVEESSAMPRAKRPSKAKRFPRKAVSVLGIAGVSLAASSSGSPADIPFAPLAPPTAGSAEDALWQNRAPFQLPAFDEEEISDVSLATFSLFDNDIGNSRPGMQLAAFRGCGCGHGCGGCRGCGGVRACGGGCRGCGVACRGCRFGGCRCGVGGCGCGGCGCGGVIWGWGGGCCLSWGGCSLWC
jgi:hypothetical protein